MRTARVLLLISLAVGVLATGVAAIETGRAFLWDGNNWQQVSGDAKAAYIFGIGNLADFENAAARGRKVACVSRVFVDDLRKKTVSQIVEEVDRFYQENPAKLSTSVIEVVLRRCTAVCPPETPVPKK